MSELVFAAAHELGMVDDSHTKKTHHDYVNILGGANLSPLLRVKYAKAEIDRAAAATPPNLVLLGSARGLSATEKIKTSGYAPGARDEFDLMNGAVETVFDASPIAEDTIDIKNTGAKEPEKGKWKVRYYDNNGIRILSLSAPQVEGTRRVNTADTYRFLKAIVGLDMLDGASILNVTTAHFGAFQHADALRLLGIPARAEIETIGYGALYAGSERKPHELLQEINSAYNQATLLAETVPELLAI
jgi:hypothetical protein